MTTSVGAPAARRPNWSPPLNWLPRTLLTPSGAIRSIAIGWLVSFPLSILLAFLVQWFAPDAPGPEFPMRGPTAIVMLVLFAPIVETVIMGAVLLVLLRIVPPTAAVIVSAVAWGALHSLFVPIWGLTIWWPFLVFSTLFVAWRSRSLAMAFTVPAATHALHNLAPALLVAAGYTG